MRTKQVGKLPALLFLVMVLNKVALCQGQNDTTTVITQLSVKSYIKQNNGVLFGMNQGIMKIEMLTPTIIHVIYSPAQNLNQYPKPAVLVRKWPDVKWDIQKTPDYLYINTDSLKVAVNMKSVAIAYYNSNDSLVLAEPQSGSKLMIPEIVQGENTWNAMQEFDFTSSEALYGLGQYQKSQYQPVLMNYADHHIHSIQLLNTNTNAVIPFLVSSKGYGILWNNSSGSWFHDSFQKGFWSNVANQIDYYFVYGPKIRNVISGYRELTGKAPMYPKWSYGFIQSRDRYTTEKQVIDVVKKYRNLHIPLDAIVQDWRYWGNDGLKGKKWETQWGNLSEWNSLTFNRERYPTPKQMMDTLHHKYHVHLFISVWPSFGVNTAIYKAMSEHGYLFPTAPWPPNTDIRIYDAFNKNARELYWRGMNEGLFSKGVDGWWLDSTEPDGFPNFYSNKGAMVQFDGHSYTFARYLNAYSLMTTTGVYENQRKTTSEKRVFILTRSSFTGQQRNAAATWSGDIDASWHVLQKQIAAGLNFTLAGIPYWTTDIGGYLVNKNMFPRGAKNEAYRKLFVRWFEYGAFCPLFRVHGANIPREIWAFGKPGSWSYDALVKTDKLRYRLMPYIYSEAWQITHNNSSLMRGLIYDFQDDPQVYDIWDEFMFGPSILVNPVTEPGVSSREVYLPKGANWIDFWSGTSFKGGQTISAPAPIAHIPLYIKSGSIVPMGPILQYATEKPADRIELRIYEGADGHFTLYEDENDNYDYEKGIYSTITFNWHNASKTLIIEKRQGTFPGMLQERTFYVVLVNKNHGTGLAVCNNPDKIIKYKGSQITVKL